MTVHPFVRSLALSVSIPIEHGNELNGTTGQIASPLWPTSGVYAGDFYWRITVTEGMTVQIEFRDFQIGATTTCSPVNEFTVRSFLTGNRYGIIELHLVINAALINRSMMATTARHQCFSKPVEPLCPIRSHHQEMSCIFHLSNDTHMAKHCLIWSGMKFHLQPRWLPQHRTLQVH